MDTDSLIAAGYAEGGLAKELALRLSEVLAELNRRDVAADIADRARRELDRCGAAPGWLMTLRESGAV